MKLVRLAKGRWEVLAVLDRQGRCPVLDFLDELNGDLRSARELLNRSLRLYMPLEGPPTASAHLCKPLGDDLFELRQPKGPKPRVLFFQDGSQRIVCTNACSKLETTPRSEIELARGLREQYLAARPEIEVVEEETS